MEPVIYLDNAATTPCAAEVIDGMLPFFTSEFANPSSSHWMGRKAAQAVENARAKVARCIGCDASEITFTGGATESNNLALLGLLGSPAEQRTRILVSAIEHKSVLVPCEMLQHKGFIVERIPVDQTGMLRTDILEERLGADVLLVSVQGANNEVGTIQPVAVVSRMAHAQGALVHCDAAQMLGKVDLRLNELGVDLASFSGHKMYGPKGIGCLFVRRGLRGNVIAPVLGGGGQEAGLRPGTLNVSGIIGLGIACELVRDRLTTDRATGGALRDLFEQTILSSVPGSWVNGNKALRLPGITNISIPGIQADVLVANAPTVCFSAGSACTSGAVSPSHVLLAMGMRPDDAECSVRISIGRYTTRADVVHGAERLLAAISCMQLQRHGCAPRHSDDS